jgi:hypothetical protein
MSPISKVVLSLALLLIAVGLFLGTSPENVTYPLVVAQRSLLQKTGQTGVVLFTPKITGNFRVSIYQNQVASPSGPIIQMTWTDELGTEQTDSGSSICPTILGTSQTYVSGCQLFVHAVGGYPILLNTYVPSGQAPYSVYTTVEEF